MAKVFLDTNIFIDIAERDAIIRKSVDGKEVFISPLSFHIFCYVDRIKLPKKLLEEYLKEYKIINLTKKLLKKSLTSPTKDLEDNIQLHSATEADCDYFLTHDKQLLKMKYFGKTEIVSSLD